MESLSEHFARMRERTRKRPFLTREELEAKGLDWIKAETTRRRYGTVANRRTAGMGDWIDHFLLVQESDKPLSLREIARRADVDVRMIWKLEHGERVGADTVKSAFIQGLGLPANGKDVRQALTLWAAERTTTEAGEGLETLTGWREGGASEDDAAFIRRAVPLLLSLTKTQREAVLASLANPRVMEAIPALLNLAKLEAKVAKSGQPKLRVMVGRKNN